MPVWQMLVLAAIWWPAGKVGRSLWNGLALSRSYGWIVHLGVLTLGSAIAWAIVRTALDTVVLLWSIGANGVATVRSYLAGSLDRSVAGTDADVS